MGFKIDVSALVTRAFNEALHSWTSWQPKLEEKIYLFCSFDLTNSTEYKSNHPIDWISRFRSFYDSISGQFTSQGHFVVWKYIGDEVVLMKEITSKEELFESPLILFDGLAACVNVLEGYHKAEPIGTLSIKATAWLAQVACIERGYSEKQITEMQKTNGYYNFRIHNSSSPHGPIDFLGKDIDLGFRIAKYSGRARLAISANFAYALYRYNNEIKKKFKYEPLSLLKIVYYANLKGIWANRSYPIIWFERYWNLNEMFVYDEEQLKQDELTKVIANIKSGFLIKENSKINYIEKIIQDLKSEKDYKKLLDVLDKLPETPLKTRLRPEIVPGEVHCAAVCVTVDGKALIAKRASSKQIYPDLWEFGCAQLEHGQSFKDVLQAAYTVDYKAILVIEENPLPLATYHFERGASKLQIPGIIFYAELNNPDEVLKNFDKNKHSKIIIANLAEIEALPDEDCVPNLKENAKKALEIWQSRQKAIKEPLPPPANS